MTNAVYSLDQALALGAVDLYVSPWEIASRSSSYLIEELPILNPGIVNRFGFLYGGQNVPFQQTTIEAAASIRKLLPNVLLGSAVNEHLYTGISTIICGHGQFKTFDIKLPSEQSSSEMLSQSVNGQSNLGWIDPTNVDGYSYLLCMGEFFIDNGITLIHFENASGVISANRNPEATLNAYKQLQLDLTAYASRTNYYVYYSATPDLAETLHLDYTYTPMRVYTTAFANNYKNRITRPGIGVGYSFTLSLNMINAIKTQIGNANTRILFYVDNWQAGQDDLTALMELDPINRRFMINSSAKVAKDNGTFFVPTLNHCYGCIPTNYIVDLSELTTELTQSSINQVISEYDARVCGDLSTVQSSLRFRSHNQYIARKP